MKKKRISNITAAYQRYERDMVALDRRRFCDCDLVAWSFHVADARHHMCFALPDLEELEHAGQRYEDMTELQRFLVHEAYLALVNVAQSLAYEPGELLTSDDAIATGKAAVERMLDALAAYVSAAEAEMRRIVLEPAALEPLSIGEQ